jgi:hypothetical protein
MTIDYNYYSFGHPLVAVKSYFAVKARKDIFDLFMTTMHPTPSLSILDLGVTPEQTLPESNHFEKIYPHKHKITAASIEDASFLERIYPGLRFIRIQRGELPFADNQFDILFCAAVVEHVGDTDSQKDFIREALRVSRYFFFTTPDRRFPVEFHTFLPFLHWLPQSMYQSVMHMLGLHFWAKTENLNLLTPKKFLSLFPPCHSLQVFKYRLFGLPSNIVIYGQK